MPSRRPEEFILPFRGHEQAAVTFGYDPGEPQWFDARAGVGSPGYPPSVEWIEVSLGAEGVLGESELTDEERDALETVILEKMAAWDAERDFPPEV